MSWMFKCSNAQIQLKSTSTVGNIWIIICNMFVWAIDYVLFSLITRLFLIPKHMYDALLARVQLYTWHICCIAVVLSMSIIVFVYSSSSSSSVMMNVYLWTLNILTCSMFNFSLSVVRRKHWNYEIIELNFNWWILIISKFKILMCMAQWSTAANAI